MFIVNKRHVNGYDVEIVKMNEVLPLHFPAFKRLDSVTDVLVKHNKTCLCTHTRNRRGAPRSRAGSESVLRKTSKENQLLLTQMCSDSGPVPRKEHLPMATLLICFACLYRGKSFVFGVHGTDGP